MIATEGEKWEKVVQFFQNQCDGEKIDLDAMLFLIGVRELGYIEKSFKKDEKLNLIHIAVCKLLEPFGFYSFDGIDEDGWPHYTTLQELPALKSGEQIILMKKAIINYFETEKLLEFVSVIEESN